MHREGRLLLRQRAHRAELEGFPDRDETEESRLPCAQAGFKTVVNIPVRLHDRLTGEVDLFQRQGQWTPALRSLLDALASHLASAMENLRLECARKGDGRCAGARLSRSRATRFDRPVARLHQDPGAADARRPARRRSGIDAAILEEIDTGVRESYGDVRELLVHFRTGKQRDIEPALATTLRKFEHQSGVATSLTIEGQGMPLFPTRRSRSCTSSRRRCRTCANACLAGQPEGSAAAGVAFRSAG